MKKIESYEWLKNRIDKYRTIDSHSNFFFLPQQIQTMIDNEKLSYHEDGKNLIIFEHETGFYRMYYFLYDLASTMNIKADFPIVIEFPYREVYTENQKMEIEYIKRLGFEIGRRSRIMSVKAQDVILPVSVPNQNTFIQYAKLTESEQITELWDVSFNKLFAFLPDKSELSQLINDKKILVIYYNDILAGVIDSEIKGKSNWIWHFAVDSKYRQKGLAKELLYYVIRMHKEEVKNFMLWVDVDNTAAVNLYKKAGYTFSAKGADEYILNS